MDRSKVDEITERVREAKFTREVVGPKIARPLAAWLDRTFADDQAAGGPDDALVSVTEQHAIETAETPGSAGSGGTGLGLGDTLDRPEELADAELGRGEARGLDSDASLEPTGQDELGFVTALKAVPAKIKEHNLVVVAAGIAFWGLLAIPAVLFATISTAGLVLNAETVKDQVEENLTALPEDARSIVGEQLESVSGSGTGGLITGLVLGLLMALWSSSGAMAKLMATLNTINGVSEQRKFPKLRGTALAMTFGGIVFISAAVFLLAVLPALLRNIDLVGDAAGTLFNWIRFPVLGLVMVIALGVLYHVGPATSGRKYRFISLGAIVATVLWVTLSGVFSIYTSTVASYNETYGSLGGLVVLLLWLFISAFVVLIGAEIHALTTRGDADSEEPASA